MLLGAVWMSLGPLLDQILTLSSSPHQLCLNYSWCGVRIELAIGSLPYPQLDWVEGVQTPWMSS